MAHRHQTPIIFGKPGCISVKKPNSVDTLRASRLWINGIRGQITRLRAWFLGFAGFRYQVFGETEYQSLAGISIAHLYNLRKSETYSGQRHQYEKTKPVCSKIGERRKPNPNGQPGFIRIDSVHQGDQDGLHSTHKCNRK